MNHLNESFDVRLLKQTLFVMVKSRLSGKMSLKRESKEKQTLGVL
jgi:hypothetical protein